MTTSRSKAQGTRFAWRLRKRFVASGLPAKTLAEEGPNDEGDIELMVWEYDGLSDFSHRRRVVVEARSRQNMSLHAAMMRALDKESRRAVKEQRPPDPVALVWERMLPLAPGRQRRVAAGPVLVTVTLDYAIRQWGGNPLAQAIDMAVNDAEA